VSLRERLAQRRREAANRAAICGGRRLVSMDVPPPLPARGMYLDPRQVPETLMRPAMDVGQPPAHYED